MSHTPKLQCVLEFVSGELVAVFRDPETNLLFHGEGPSTVLLESRFQQEGLSFERNGDVQVCSEKPAHEEFQISIQPQYQELDSMHQAVEQRPGANSFIEHHYVQISERSHVRHLRKIRKAEGLRFCIKRRIRHTGTPEFHNPDLVQQAAFEKWLKKYLVLRTDRLAKMKEILALFAKISSNAFNGSPDLLLTQVAPRCTGCESVGQTRVY